MRLLKNALLNTGLAVCALGESQAKQPSFLFDSDHVKAVELARYQDRIRGEDLLTCTGFLYVSDTAWQIWLNGKKYTRQDLKRIGYMVLSAHSKGLEIKTGTTIQCLKPGKSIPKLVNADQTD